MDAIDLQWIGIHHDQAEISLVAGHDEGLESLRPLAIFGAETAEEILYPMVQVRGISSQLLEDGPVPAVEVVPAMPALNRGQRRFGNLGRSSVWGGHTQRVPWNGAAEQQAAGQEVYNPKPGCYCERSIAF
jgi:hypothetical protein